MSYRCIAFHLTVHLFFPFVFSLYTQQYRQEVDSMDLFENNVATHLTRILYSSKHSEVISSARYFSHVLQFYFEFKADRWKH